MNLSGYELSPEELKQWCDQHEEIVNKRIEELKTKLAANKLKANKPKLYIVKG